LEKGVLEKVTMTQWNEVYKKEESFKYYDLNNPHQDIPKLTKIFSKNSKILDLGCGSGRNLIYLAKKGFQIYGLDSAEKGIKIIKQKLKKDNLQSKLTTQSFFQTLPYKDSSFDIIISIQSLQHGTETQIKKTIKEIHRILKPNGKIFVTLCGRYSKGKIRYCLVKTAKKIAPNTYKPTIGKEKDLTHFIYNKKLIQKHFKHFKITKFWKDDKDYYCFLAKKR